ncbi:uncharacterized protein LOC134815951 [Bolinopsis microptera]|uniref:uncharacterized protein LOC134815951 n=1 Tax=Bolinopsis microptera TaxID=2820187 RepID=UPI00307A5D9B
MGQEQFLKFKITSPDLPILKPRYLSVCTLRFLFFVVEVFLVYKIPYKTPRKMLLPLALLLVIGSFPATVEANKHRALRFGQSRADYIEWSPNMAPFKRQFSVCTWLKKRHQSSAPMVVNYNPYEYGMILGDNGYYNLVVGSDFFLSEYNVPDGEWFHVCWLWSASSYTTTVYLNGEIIGSTATHQRELRTGGTMCLGNYAASKESRYAFGGDLFKLNLYSRVLTDTEIRNMASDICSNEEENLNSIRSLRWESIILQERSGSVTEITGCSPEEIEAGRRAGMLRLIKERLETFGSRLKNTEQELARTKTNLIQSDKKLKNVTASLTATQEKLKNSEQELAETKSNLNQQLENVITSLTGTQNKLNDTEQELAETKSTLDQRLNQTEDKLENVTTSLKTTQEKLKNSEQDLAETKSTLKVFEEKLGSFNFSLASTQNEVSNTQLELTATKNSFTQQLESVTVSLNHTQEELEAATKNKVRSKWDVLFSDRFFNKQLTREMSQELKSAWDVLDLFLGANITEPVIEHLKQQHEPRVMVCANPRN